MFPNKINDNDKKIYLSRPRPICLSIYHSSIDAVGGLRRTLYYLFSCQGNKDSGRN